MKCLPIAILKFSGHVSDGNCIVLQKSEPTHNVEEWEVMDWMSSLCGLNQSFQNCCQMERQMVYLINIDFCASKDNMCYDHKVTLPMFFMI